ncbi:MAG: hypothetical protein AAGC57_21300 [Pseudomonadota bacterium]
MRSEFHPTEVETLADLDGDGQIDLLIGGYTRTPVGPDGPYRSVDQGVILLIGHPAWSSPSKIPIDLASLMDSAAQTGDISGAYISYSGVLDSTASVQVLAIGDVKPIGAPTSPRAATAMLRTR